MFYVQVIENDWNTILILEDDIDFQPNFNNKVVNILETMKEHSRHWDLMYVCCGCFLFTCHCSLIEDSNCVLSCQAVYHCSLIYDAVQCTQCNLPFVEYELYLVLFLKLCWKEATLSR